MSYQHGVSIQEIPTSVRPAVQVDSALPVYVGVAPIQQNLTNVNKPVLLFSLAEAVEQFGFSDDIVTWTLMEAIKAHFQQYQSGPIVAVNVLDPEVHEASEADEPHSFSATVQTVTLDEFGAFDVTQVEWDDASVWTVAAETTSWTQQFDNDGNLTVTRVAGGTIPETASIRVTYDRLNPAAVAAADIIGAYTAGVYTGLQVVHQVYPQFRKVPAFIAAPGWSDTPSVGAAMVSVAGSVSGMFRAVALTDADPSISDYTDVPAWKTTNSYTSENQAVCYGLARDGVLDYHLSTAIAAIAGVTDNANGGIPLASPSNKRLVAQALVASGGEELFLTQPQANFLNGNGIITAINTSGGWRSWGNRTGAYPANTDPKDAFLAVRRMMNFVGNTIILTAEQFIDDPANRRLVDSVLGTCQSFLNGLVAAGALVSGTVLFRESDNSTTSLSDGIVRFYVEATPPSPARSLEFLVEYNPAALAALFGE